jgi:hypothetical protein
MPGRRPLDALVSFTERRDYPASSARAASAFRSRSFLQTGSRFTPVSIWQEPYYTVYRAI